MQVKLQEQFFFDDGDAQSQGQSQDHFFDDDGQQSQEEFFDDDGQSQEQVQSQE